MSEFNNPYLRAVNWLFKKIVLENLENESNTDVVNLTESVKEYQKLTLFQLVSKGKKEKIFYTPKLKKLIDVISKLNKYYLETRSDLGYDIGFRIGGYSCLKNHLDDIFFLEPCPNFPYQSGKVLNLDESEAFENKTKKWIYTTFVDEDIIKFHRYFDKRSAGIVSFNFEYKYGKLNLKKIDSQKKFIKTLKEEYDLINVANLASLGKITHLKGEFSSTPPKIKVLNRKFLGLF